MDNIIYDMKAISVAVSEEDYEEFRSVANREGRSIAQLIREAMALYRETKMKRRPPLHDLPQLVGHQLVAALPSRSEIYDEIYAGADDK